MKIHNEEMLNEFYKHDKLNVAIVADIYKPSIGGATFVIDNLANSFSKFKDVNVCVITGEVKNYEDEGDFPIIRCKSVPIPKHLGDSLPLPKLDRKFKKLIKKLNIDVIDVHTVFGIATYMISFAHKNNIPIFYHAHSKFNQEYPTIIKFKPLCNFMVKKAFDIVNRCDYIIPVSYNTKDVYVEQNIKKPMTVLLNATEMVEFKDTEKAYKFVEQKINLSVNEENVLIYVGRMEIECKNLDLMLNSLKLAKNKGFNFKLLMVGVGKDDAKLRKMVKSLELENEVIFVGKVVDRIELSQYYKRSDLLYFPSVRDTSSLAKVEAASQKTPTLAIYNTGPSERMVDNENGYLSYEDAEKLSDKLIEIFSNKERLKLVSDNALKTLGQTWEQNAKQCIELFKSLSKDKNDGK